MGANAARHTLEIIGNVRHVLAIELLTAAQAIDLREEGATRLGQGTTNAHSRIREKVEFLEKDRSLAPDIEALSRLIATGELIDAIEDELGGEL
jgi:histidine ammonia-lyase